MQTFNFPYHTVETENPESSFRVKLGNSYTFTSTPVAPDQRLFKLSFKGLYYYTDSNGAVIVGPDTQLSFKSLIDFYQAHKLHASFLYMHPVYGQLEVKFNKPLIEPPSREGGYGFSEPFQLEFLEIP